MKSLHIFICLLSNLIYHSTISQEKYFQQKVDTYIDVELDDKKIFYMVLRRSFTQITQTKIWIQS